MRAVTLYVTGSCNLRCTHCAVGLDQDSPRTQLSTAEVKKVLSRLAEGGAKYATLLGGEATIYRRDLSDLLDHAHTVGLRVSINTNATVYGVLARLLDKPALESLVVSLDGASPQTHDAMRGAGAFKRTMETLRRVSAHPRLVSGELALELSYVISKANAEDAGQIVVLADELGAKRLNAKHVKLTGRANEFASELGLTSRELLDAYTLMLVTWLLGKQALELDVHIPPAFAYYLNSRFGTSLPIDDHPACGGIEEFGYVDLLGNYLPCPAMSYEEDPLAVVSSPDPGLQLVDNSTATVHTNVLFQEFEDNRRTQAYRNRLFPCRVCRFNELSRPCTADLIKGADEAEVDICRAVFENGEDDVPGLREYVFSGGDTP